MGSLVVRLCSEENGVGMARWLRGMLPFTRLSASVFRYNGSAEHTSAESGDPQLRRCKGRPLAVTGRRLCQC
jgi:hypothetical protein